MNPDEWQVFEHFENPPGCLGEAQKEDMSGETRAYGNSGRVCEFGEF